MFRLHAGMFIVCVQCLGKSEEGVRIPEAGVTTVVSYIVVPKNQIQVICTSSQCSSLLGHLSTFKFLLLLAVQVSAGKTFSEFLL